MWAGPNRAPGRELTPESNGEPTTAMSARSTSSSRGRRAKVAGPAKRGTSVASTGPTGPSLMRANVHRAGLAWAALDWLAGSLRSDGVEDVQAGGTTSGEDRGQHSRDRGERHEQR